MGFFKEPSVAAVQPRVLRWRALRAAAQWPPAFAAAWARRPLAAVPEVGTVLPPPTPVEPSGKFLVAFVPARPQILAEYKAHRPQRSETYLCIF